MKNTVSSKSIKNAIEKVAQNKKRKRKIYDTVLALNEELKDIEETQNEMLNEHMGLAGSFGFASPGDQSSKTKTGFKDNFGLAKPHLSYILSLEDEINAAAEKESTINEETMDELNRLREENEKMKEELEKMKTSK